MTFITRRTTMETANALHDGIQKFDFVPTHLGIKVGDTIRYTVKWQQKDVPHVITKDRFKVTCVLNDDPRVHKSLSLIGLEKIDLAF